MYDIYKNTGDKVSEESSRKVEYPEALAKNMVIISNYKLLRKEDFVFLVVPEAPAPCCPCCGGALFYRDSRKRICKKEGGIKNHLIIRRLRCASCGTLHNELPDRLVPYKHYETEVISGVLDGAVTAEDVDSEDYPCMDTMRHWKFWFFLNQATLEKYASKYMDTFPDAFEKADGPDNSPGNRNNRDSPDKPPGAPGNPGSSGQASLMLFRKVFPDWLERSLGIIYNNDEYLYAYA